jgi:hypothetical protein
VEGVPKDAVGSVPKDAVGSVPRDAVESIPKGVKRLMWFLIMRVISQ